jgi:hypothetical protein
MPVKIIVFLFFAFPLSCFAAQMPRYEIDAEVDTASHKIKARQKVTFTNNTDKELTEIYFHIYPNRKYSESEKRFLARYAAYFKINPYPEGFQGGAFNINSISSDNQGLAYKIEGDDRTILKIELPGPLMPGFSIVIDMGYTVDIPHSYGRFGWHKNITSLLRWYPMLSVLDKDGWHNYPFYPYHQPYFSDAANYTCRLTVPRDEVVAHSGIAKSEAVNTDGTKTIEIESEAPLRDFGLGISPGYKVESRDLGGVKINSYYLEGDIFYAKKAIEFASDLMGYYSRKFAAYPYKEFNIVPGYLGYGGTQSSNLMLIDTRAYKLPKFLIRYFDFLVAHEAGHQWFYNLVGSDEYAQMFIDEGFNSHFILSYLNDKYGAEAEVMVLPKALKWLVPNFSFSRAAGDRYSFVAKNGLDRAVIGKLSSFQEPSSIFSITYGKGSKIVGMLEYVMGDEAFNRFMQRYFKEYAFKNISVKDIRALAEKESAKDLGWFFEGWLNKPLICGYSVKKVEGNKIYLANCGSISMPVNISVKLENGQIMDYAWDGEGKEKEIIVDSPARIESVRLDPENKILDLDRTDNNWRRRVDFRPVILYHPMYEIPVFLKEDAYTFVVGPELASGGFGVKASLQKPQDNILYVSSVYDSGEERIKNTAGFEQRHLSGKMLKWGIEGFDYNDVSGEDDLEGFKLYLRKELWPASYSLFEENDHASLYLLKNRDFKSGLTSGGLEDIRNLYYSRQDEAILGMNLKFGRYGTYPDPSKGWKFNMAIENAGHFLGGDSYFWRMSPELTRYFSVAPKQKIAARVKLGLGYPSDKGLFQLGGEKGLRGYPYKTINGSQSVMFNAEYRADLIDGLNMSFFDNIISLKKIQGAGFFDVGKSWFASFSDRDFKKDAGLGLRLHFDVAGFLEQVILRLDAAQAINEPKEDTRFWFGLSQAF